MRIDDDNDSEELKKARDLFRMELSEHIPTSSDLKHGTEVSKS